MIIRECELAFIYVSDIGGEVQPKELEGKLGEYGKTFREKAPGPSWIEEGIRVAAKDAVEVLGIKSDVEIKVFSIGGILVRINVPVRDMAPAQVLEFISRAEDDDYSKAIVAPSAGPSSSFTDAGAATATLAGYARNLACKVREDIKPFITSQYTRVDYEERYRVVLVRDGDRDAIEKSKKEIVGLIRKEPFERLCMEEVDEIAANSYAFRDNFFVADVRGAFGFVKNVDAFPVPRAVELCLLEKLQLRVYDSLLDDMLGKSYDILAKAESKADRELGERINDIHLMRLELLEIVSAMKAAKGSPRARAFSSLYDTLGEVFELQDMVDSVTRKLDRLGEIYTMVYDSLQNTRFIKMDRTMLMLEAIIVALIAIEIILILAGKL